MSEVLTQIRQLVNRREAALREAEQLGTQIAEIRALLGVPDESEPVLPARHPATGWPRPRRIAMGGLSQGQLLKSLAERQPQTARMLKERFPEMTTLGIHLSALYKAGQIIRRRREDGGNVLWYAVSADAFIGDGIIWKGEGSESDSEPG